MGRKNLKSIYYDGRELKFIGKSIGVLGVDITFLAMVFLFMHGDIKELGKFELVTILIAVGGLVVALLGVLLVYIQSTLRDIRDI